MDKFQELSALLEEQLSVQKQLLKMEQQKTDVLVKGTVAQLDELVNAQQPYLMKASNLEKKRQAWQESMGMDGMTLRQILETYPEAAGLQQIYENLNDVLADLKQASALNQRILHTKLEVLNGVLTKAGLTDPPPVTYSNNK